MVTYFVNDRFWLVRMSGLLFAFRLYRESSAPGSHFADGPYHGLKRGAITA